MNGMSAQQADPAMRYLWRLRRELRLLPEGDRNEIVAEIESHIAERLSLRNQPIEGVLEGLGAPEILARAYLEDYELFCAVQRASPLLLLFTALSRATRSITAFLVGVVAVGFYALAVSLAAIVVLKPILPLNVGLWTGPHSLSLGVLSAPPSTPERLGLWIMPAALVGAILCYVAGTGLMKLWGRGLLRRSRVPAPA